MFLIQSDHQGAYELSNFIRRHSTSLTKLDIFAFHPLHTTTVREFWGLAIGNLSRLHTPETLFSTDLFTEAIPSRREVKDLGSHFCPSAHSKALAAHFSTGSHLPVGQRT
jgi:hypothetical protein